MRTTQAAETVLPVILSSLSGRGFRIEQASTHEDALFVSVKHRVLPAWLFGTLGFGALLLTGVGVLGLLAMSAAQRTREVGIRIAIGATPSRVVRELLREQLGAVLVGLAGGMLVSAVAARFIEAHLYRISPFDPAVWAIGAVTVIGVAAAGAWNPVHPRLARRSGAGAAGGVGLPNGRRRRRARAFFLHESRIFADDDSGCARRPLAGASCTGRSHKSQVDARTSGWLVIVPIVLFTGRAKRGHNRS